MPETPPLLVVNARVIDPTSGRDEVCDVAFEGGRVAGIGKGLSRGPVNGTSRPGGAGYPRVIDGEGLILAPGLIDPHVHLRDPGHPGKEDIGSGTAAAVSGGFTAVCCMPNTVPCLDTPEMVEYVRLRGAERGRCRVFAVAAATQGRQGERLAEIRLCAKAGAVGFSDDGDVVASAGVMRGVLEEVRLTGRAFMQHAQEPTLTKGAAMHAGAVSARLGLGGWPREAEEIIVQRDIRLNCGVGCRYHVQHVSCKGTVECIRWARAEGMPVSGEASPHHLLLTDAACEGYDTSAKVNPPLREAADVAALVEGVADGSITVLATDHAPHTAEEKGRAFAEAPFGIVGLESALALYAEALVESGAIGWERLIALLTIEPARLCGLEAMGLGMLKVGGPGDATLIDPGLEWTLTREELAGRSGNTPFLGRRLRGRAVATVVGGEVRCERGRVMSHA